MNSPAHADLRRLFDLALAAPRDQRAALLDRECKGDTALRKRLEAMLAAAEDDRFLASPTHDAHPNIAAGMNNLASLLQVQNKLAEAEPLSREALAIMRASLPAGHPDIAFGLSNLARLQNALGQTAEARAGFDEAIAIHRQSSPDGSPLLARFLWRSGTARLENKDYAAALAELEEVVAMAEKMLPAEHPHLKEYRETLTKCKAAMEGGGAEQKKPNAKGGG